MREMREKADITYAGIDPGKSGALALLRPDGTVALEEYVGPRCYVPTLEALRGVPHVVVVERLFARPGKLSSAKANFELGRCVGELETMLGMMSVGFQAVTPQAWQREFGLSGDKAEHVRMARQLFPSASLRRSERCRTDFDGFADALLMAEYARRRLS